MDVSTLTRNASKVRDTLIEKNNCLITKSGCKIHTPKRYIERHLATIGENIKIIGILTIVVEDKYYSIMKIPSLITIKPTEIRTDTIDNVEYFIFGFDPGEIVFTSLDLVMDLFTIYNIYNEVIAKGHVPWSFNYDDLGTLFENSLRYVGGSLSRNNVILEMIGSSISRDPADLTKFYRHLVQNPKNVTAPKFIAFREVIYGANNTTSKLLGAYFDDSVVSALVNPSERVEGVETILRS